VARQPPRGPRAGRPRRRALARLLPGSPGLSGPRPRARAKAAAIAAVALILAAIAAALSGGGHAGTAKVAVDTGAPGRAVPASFLGLSMEWTSVAPFGGPGRAGVVALLRRVEAAGGSPLTLRVGGASGEEAWWNPDHRRPRPRTILHDIDPATLAALAALARGLDAPATIGLNLQLGDAPNALALARAAQRRLGPLLDGLEIGNEPDLYTRARSVGPLPVRRLRKRLKYTPDDYVRDAGRALDAIAPRISRPPWLVVGGFAGRAGWATHALPALIDSRRGRVGAVAAHLYGLPGCHLRPDAAQLRQRLLGEAASRGRAQALAPVIAIAHRRGLPLWVAELNSAPCGGAPGVSDSFASALWLTDALFALVRAGADRADVHTWDGAVYAPFARRDRTVSARPPFFGMLAFARAAPRGSRLVPVRVRDAGRVRAWATTDRGGTVRVALIAASDAARVRVRLAVGAGRPCATVRVTSAPSLAAHAGIAERPAQRRCPRAGALGLVLPGPSIAVVTLPARAR
jgi:hypothetical protein